MKHRILSALLIGLTGAAQAQTQTHDWLGDMRQDAQRFYSTDRLERLGLGLGAAALLANSNADASLQDRIQAGRTTGTNSFSTSVKPIGEWTVMLPISLAVSSLLPKDDGGVQAWGNSTLRAIVVGSPSVLLVQRVGGAGRPNQEGEANPSANWTPFKNAQTASGHAFVGAIPFMVMGELNSHNQLLKYTGYAASWMLPFARVNDNDHYPSQALLGWYMAYESVQTVMESGPRKDTAWRFAPVAITQGELGFGVQKRW